MPLPPPPPPGPPPPPAFNAAPPPITSKSSSDNRNQLLVDIRKGTGLRKVQTNDRSAPILETRSNAKNGGGAPQMNGGPVGLGGLFAGGMPKLKPAGAPKGIPLMPPGSKKTTINTVDDNNYENSNQHTQNYPTPIINNKTSSIPPGFGTVRKNFLGEAMKSQAPLPPPATMKPNGLRTTGGPPLPNKPPNVRPTVKLTPPANKPPPPPKSPAVMAANGPPALPSKPPSCRRHQSFNENDVRQSGINLRNSRPNMQVKLSPTEAIDHAQSPTQSPDTLNVRPPSFKNVSTPNLAAVGKAGPPPLPPARDNAATVAFQQYHTMPGKLGNGPPPPPPPNRTTPYQPKPNPPSNRPPPPPPVKQIQSPPNPPPPPPHRVNPPLPPPPVQQQQINRSIQQQQAPNSTLPPPPPVRNSSARNSLTGSISNNADELLESRVYHMFVSINSLPAPDPFTNVTKTYASKNIQGRREAAPPIPTDAMAQYQIGAKMWANPTSEC